jgi:flagellar hook-basal body complex protein FliE
MSIDQLSGLVPAGLGGVDPTRSSSGVAPTERIAPAGASFQDRLESAIKQVSDHQNAADVRLSRLASGDDVDVHSTMIALEEADIMLKLMVSTREAAVEAFEKVQNLQI